MHFSNAFRKLSMVAGLARRRRRASSRRRSRPARPADRQAAQNAMPTTAAPSTVPARWGERAVSERVQRAVV
eukprot:947656-Prymnesium_polylepis.2